MESILAGVQKAFSLAFEVDPQTVTIDTTPQDITAWDSMGHVMLASNLEGAFHVTFSVDELMAMENVREIVKILESKLQRT